MKEKIVVAVDAMGGDNAPAVEVQGAVAAARRWGVSIILVGDRERVEACLAQETTSGLDIRIQHASEVIGMKDSASDAVRKKKDSSVRVAFDLVRDGEAHAVVSAGNSGATLAVGMFRLKRIRGIDRPAIATIMPNMVDQTVVLDVGGTVDCKPAHLEQFALMGEIYAKSVLGKTQPRIGILSNGEEDSKGNDLTRQAHQLLKGSDLNYLGFVEGRDLFNGKVDVVVCDGFVGNIVLKVSEGLAEAISSILRREIGSRLLAKIGYLLCKPAFAAFKKRIDYAEYGGAPLLGIQGTGMICHGGSASRAIMNAIGLARESVAQRVNDRLIEHLHMGADDTPADEKG